MGGGGRDRLGCRGRAGVRTGPEVTGAGAPGQARNTAALKTDNSQVELSSNAKEQVKYRRKEIKSGEWVGNSLQPL